jgi:hypothetical protein
MDLLMFSTPRTCSPSHLNINRPWSHRNSGFPYWALTVAGDMASISKDMATMNLHDSVLELRVIARYQLPFRPNPPPPFHFCRTSSLLKSSIYSIPFTRSYLLPSLSNPQNQETQNQPLHFQGMDSQGFRAKERVRWPRISSIVHQPLTFHSSDVIKQYNQSAQQSPLLRFPTEMRDHIYNYVLDRSNHFHVNRIFDVWYVP